MLLATNTTSQGTAQFVLETATADCQLVSHHGWGLAADRASWISWDCRCTLAHPAPQAFVWVFVSQVVQDCPGLKYCQISGLVIHCKLPLLSATFSMHASSRAEEILGMSSQATGKFKVDHTECWYAPVGVNFEEPLQRHMAYQSHAPQNLPAKLLCHWCKRTEASVLIKLEA